MRSIFSRCSIPRCLLAVQLAALSLTAQPARAPKVSAAVSHGVYIDSQGNRWGWGHNLFGEYGGGGASTPRGSWTPVPVPGRTDIVDVAVAEKYSLFLLADGTALAAGVNGHGQLGIGRMDILPGTRETRAPVAVPTPVAGLSRVKQLAAGSNFALALIEDGTVMAWGERDSGKLGDGEVGPFRDRVNDIPAPRPVRGLSGVRQIAAGRAFALALMSDGTVMGWGRALNGQLGEAVAAKSGLPVAIRGLERVKQIAAAELNGLALLEDGTVRTWGTRSCAIVLEPHAVDPNGGFSAIPVLVPGLSGVRSLVAGGDSSHVMAILNDGTVRTWGCNGYFDQGLGHKEELPNRLGQPKISGVVAGAVARMTTFFVLRDGTLLASGAIFPQQSQLYKVPTVLVKGLSGR